MNTYEDEPEWNFDECVARSNTAHRNKQRIARELEQTREQDRKQWEFTNGGRNPIGNDPEGLDIEEQEMYRKLGEADSKMDRYDQSDDTFQYIIIVVAILAFTYLYIKHFA